MLDSISELEKFIKFAVENRVKRFKINDIEVELSEYAHLERIAASPVPGLDPIKLPKTEEQLKQEEEDLLFHSSGG